MNSFVIAYLLALATMCAHHVQSQRALPFEDRIINGTYVIIEDFPFMAAIIGDNGYLCSGFIVTNHWVLTCAHCYHSRTGNTVANTAVYVGGNNPPTNGRQFRLVRLVVHPSYANTQRYYDLALVKTIEEIKFSRQVQPAVLPTANEGTPAVGTKCHAVGFGLGLRKAAVKVIRNNICEKFLAYRPTIEHPWIKFKMNNMFCIRTVHEFKMLSHGDSGGAVVCNHKVVGQIKNTQARPIRISEGPPHVGGMNDLARYQAWIQETTRM